MGVPGLLAVALTAGALWILFRGTESIEIGEVIAATSALAKLLAAYVVLATVLRIAGNLSERQKGRPTRLGEMSRRAGGPVITRVVDGAIATVISLACLAASPLAQAATATDAPPTAPLSTDNSASTTPPSAGTPAPEVDAWLAGELPSPAATATAPSVHSTPDPPRSVGVSPPAADERAEVLSSDTALHRGGAAGPIADPPSTQTASRPEADQPTRRVGLPENEKALGPTYDQSNPIPGAKESAYVVRRGDSLWRIASHELGDTASPAEIDSYWRQIYAANEDAVGPNPSLIRPGLELELPPAEVESRAGGR